MPESGAVLACGVAAAGLYGVRKLSEGALPAVVFAYVPILGGLIETAALFFVWTAVLQALRISRPLRRERRLWGGLLVALVPPVIDLTSYVVAWKP